MNQFKTTSLADQVFEKLENDIIQGVYPRGEILTELKLVDQLGVSRTPIREAIRRLEQERILEDSGHGLVVIGISREDIVYALDAIQNPMSLYEPIFTDGGDTLYVMDQIRDKKNREENWVEHLSLSDALKKLNAREHEIISLRFFEGKTQMEVAELIGISQAQVSRLEKNALRIMRAYLSA